MELNHNFAWHQSIIRELRFFLSCYECGTKKKFWVPHEESNVRPSDSFTVSRVYYEVQKTRLHHTAGIKYSIYKLIIVWDFLDMDQCVVFLGKSLYSECLSLLWSINEYRRIFREAWWNIYADSAYVLVFSFLACLDEYQPRKCINGELAITNKRAFYASIYCDTPWK